MQHVPLRDTRLAVHTRGSGLPFLLLHGFPLDHGMWSGQEPLAEHLRLIVPDQRGFGASGAMTGAFIGCKCSRHCRSRRQPSRPRL